MILTKDDVKAIRTADALSVWFRATEGTVTLSLVKKIKPKAGFEETEVRRELTDEQEEWSPYQACFSLLFTHYGAWQLLAHTVKEGDRLTLSCRENSNGYLEKAMIPAERWDEESRRHHGTYGRLYKDELLATLTRNGKVIVRELVLEDTIAPDNTARGIQYKRAA